LKNLKHGSRNPFKGEKSSGVFKFLATKNGLTTERAKSAEETHRGPVGVLHQNENSPAFHGPPNLSKQLELQFGNVLFFRDFLFTK
jgi:hypothetical protein